METTDAVRALAALAHDSRLKIFRALVQAGRTGMSAGEVGAALGIPPATLSFHLKELAIAGLAGARQDGRFVFYSADYPRMDELLRFLTDNCCAADGCGTSCSPVANKRRTKARRKA
jgi:DNA-binding transcriptional ArsR family regulator